MTLIAPRSDYQDILARLAKFDDFHLEEKAGQFDAGTEELAIRAVKLFAQVDQAVRDLAIPLLPGTIDVIFRGATVPETTYEAKNWEALLSKAEKEAEPILAEVRAELDSLTQLQKEEADTAALMASLRVVSNISSDLGIAAGLRRLRVFLSIVNLKSSSELEKSLSDVIFLSQPLTSSQSLVLIAGPASEFSKVDRVVRAFELKPLSLPESLPQNPLEAYGRLEKQMASLISSRMSSEKRIQVLKEEQSESLLAIREVAQSANSVLDDVRTSGKLERIASVSGFIPTKRQEDFEHIFDTWIVVSERASWRDEEGNAGVPTLMANPWPTKSFEKITESQGFPGGPEVDPTPLVAFVFPAFFGMMFGDLGHGIVVTAFSLLLRSRKNANLRVWGNIFLAAGISACVFGVLFGEFFGFDLGQLVPIPKALEIVNRAGTQPTLDQQGIAVLLTVALLIGFAHMTTGMVLGVVKTVRKRARAELVLEQIPGLVMYLSGVAFALSFIGAGFSFNMYNSNNPVPLLGIRTRTLGLVSTVVVLGAAIVIAGGKGVATVVHRWHGESAAIEFINGIIELLVKIAEFLANTISYARLGVLLLVHCALLIAVNMLAAFPVYISIVPIVIFNVMIILLEGLIVYIQDLRLHLYEFFTKFYEGNGTPFRKLLPERVRTKIDWT